METLRPSILPMKQEAPPPSATAAATPSMEFAHVLFMDVVGYSKLQMNQQADVQMQLQQLVQATNEVQNARRDNKLIIRPTGDGMALLFLRDVLSPVRCALQLHTQLQAKDAEIRKRTGVSIKLRMGIHSGTVLLVEDMNAQSDVAGEAIIIAQRVMDCGDSGHILLSEDVAKKLIHIDPWPRYLTDLGGCRVKHGTQVHLFNLVGRLDGPFCGNAAIPKKVEQDVSARAQEIKKYRGTFFERNPAVKRWLINGAVWGTLIGGGYYVFATIPAAGAMVRTTYAKFAVALQPPPTKAAQKTKPVKNGKTGVKNKPSGKTSRSTRATPQVAAAPRIVSVPEMLGMTLGDARAAAKENGLRLIRSPKSGYSSQYGEGMVYEQSPASGGAIRAGGAVYVRVSKGDPTAEEIITPPSEDAEPAADKGVESSVGTGEVQEASVSE